MWTGCHLRHQRRFAALRLCFRSAAGACSMPSPATATQKSAEQPQPSSNDETSNLDSRPTRLSGDFGAIARQKAVPGDTSRP